MTYDVVSLKVLDKLQGCLDRPLPISRAPPIFETQPYLLAEYTRVIVLESIRLGIEEGQIFRTDCTTGSGVAGQSQARQTSARWSPCGAPRRAVMIPKQELPLQIREKAVSSRPRLIIENPRRGLDCCLHGEMASWIQTILR